MFLVNTKPLCFGFEEIKILSENLEGNESLTSLNLCANKEGKEKNEFSIQLSQNISNFISKNENLVELKIEANLIGDQGLFFFIKKK